jgi:hypothetical protein
VRNRLESTPLQPFSVLGSFGHLWIVGIIVDAST